MHRTLRIVLPAVLSSAILVSCGVDPLVPAGTNALVAPGSASPASKVVPDSPPPAREFVSEITNPYLAFRPGRVFHYESHTPEGLETTVTEVTHKTRMILGVATTVVHDAVSLNGSLIEETFDWYAQDKDGNVWYFGEDSKEIQDGVVVSTEGSWEAGVNGAEAGIIMLANPKVGTQYRQEFSAGVAEDMAKVTSLKETVQVPYGSFDGCLQTMEWTPLSPGARENKYYVPGTGLVLETGKRGERVELIAVEH